MDRVLAIVALRLKLAARSLLGKGGTANLLGSIGLTVLGGLVAVTLAVGFGIMTHVMASDGDPQAIRIGYLICFYTFLFFGIVMPILAGAMEESFDAAPFLIFPISRLRLFGVTQASMLGSPHHLLYFPALLAVTLTGVLFSGINRIAGLLVILLVLGFYLTWANLLSLLLVSVMRGRRTREIGGILALGLVVMASLLPGLLEDRSERLREAIPRFAGALELAAAASRALPPSLAADGLTALHRTAGGETGLSAASHIFWLLVWNAAGTGLGYAVFSRYYLGDRQVRTGRSRPATRTRVRGRTPRWLSFDRGPLASLPLPVRAVAAKDLHYILRSVVGRFNLFVVPVFVSVLVFAIREIADEPILGIDPERALLFGALFYSLFFTGNLVNNTFAWEGGGIQAYFLGPNPLTTVIYGKNVAVWIYNAILFLLLMICWSVGMGPPAPSLFFSAVLMYACAIVLFTCFGNFLSILYPVRRNMSKINNSPSQIVVLAQFGTIAITLLLIGPFLSIPALLGWEVLQPVLLALLLAGLIVLYAVLLAPASRLMAKRRERLIEALESAG